jgi:hypothetical protein
MNGDNIFVPIYLERIRTAIDQLPGRLPDHPSDRLPDPEHPPQQSDLKSMTHVEQAGCR